MNVTALSVPTPEPRGDRFSRREFFDSREDDQCATPEQALATWRSRRHIEVRKTLGRSW
jgi:hypothetical protein